MHTPTQQITDLYNFDELQQITDISGLFFKQNKKFYCLQQRAIHSFLQEPKPSTELSGTNVNPSPSILYLVLIHYK